MRHWNTLDLWSSKLIWKVFLFRVKLRRAMFWAKHDWCWHWWRHGAWIKGRRCSTCWLRHEMFQMLRAEEDKQILYGEGG